MFGLDFFEMITLGVIGVLLFGKKLPDVGRSLAQSIMEFKKGLNGIKNELQDPSPAPKATAYRSPDDYQEPTAPRFVPPTSEPQPIEKSADETAQV